MAKVFQLPNAVAADSSAWALTGAATKAEAVDDPNGQPDDDTSYLECETTSGGSEQIEFGFPPMPEAVSIVQVTIHIRSKELSGVANHAPFVRSAGSEFDGAGISLAIGVWADHSHQFTTDPATGLDWSRAGVDAMTAGVKQAAADAEARLTQIIREVEFVPFSVKSEAALEVASREIRLDRQELMLPEISGPLPWGDAELLEDIGYSDFAYPDARGYGKGAAVWERALLRMMSLSIDLDQLTVTRRGLDLLGYLCHFWDSGGAEAAAGSAPSSRPARLDPGAARAFSRPSKAWCENGAVAAQGGVQLIEVGADVEKVELLGNLIEPARENAVLNSAFASGTFDDWTETGNVAPDTGDLLWDPTITTRSARFARSGTSDERLSQGIAYSGSEVLTLSRWGKDDDGAAMGWSAQRSTDSWWWNDSTEAWQSGGVINLFTVRSAPARDVSHPIVLSAAAQTVTFTFYAESAADQVAHLYHTQVEEGRYATSAIFTAGAAATREADVLRMENDGPNGSCWLGGQGTAGMTWIPEMGEDDEIAEVSVLLNTTDPGDGDDFDRVLYDHGAQEFQFMRKAGASTWTASKAHTLTRGQPVRVVARSTGEQQELGLAVYTLSIFVDGVRGTDDVANVGPQGGAWLDIGSSEDSFVQGSFAGGHLSDINIIPQVLPDEAVGDWR